MARKVLLPREIANKLDDFAKLNEEVNGILLYRRIRDYCPIEALLMTGVGSASHVQAQEDRIAIANEFFRQNPDYRFVKFHTHPRGTIRNFGEHYAKHFSAGDIKVIKEQLKYDRDFMAILVTPITKLLSGIDNPELRIVEGFRGYKKRSQVVSQALKVIARNLGYDLSRLQATRR